MPTLVERSASSLQNAATEMVAADAAELLYGHAKGGIAITAMAATVLAIALDSPARHTTLMIWCLAMALVLMARTWDVVRWHHTPPGRRPPGPASVRRFSAGSLLTATLWILLPLLFFLDSDDLTQAAIATVLAWMAGGSITVLAPARFTALAYCAALLLPVSSLLIVEGGREHVSLGMLGYAFFLVMTVSSKVTHRAILSASRLNRANQALLAEMQLERARTEDANRGLRDAKTALIEANLSLEDRIHARTEALQREMRDKERYAGQLAELAARDPLTGLHNRTTLVERMHGLIGQATSDGQALAVMFIDLDQFKEVNDVQGHFVGDQVLRTVAERLAEGLPAGTELARWGGDEFVAVMRGQSQTLGAKAIGQSIRAHLARPIELGGDSVRIDASIGLAYFPDHGATPEDLIRSADVAMYAAKSGGEHHAKVFDPSLAVALRERHMLGQALRDAVAHRRLDLVYQPIVSSTDGSCAGMEALVRWDPPDRHAVGPAEFIPIAERTGTILPLGRWVLTEACLAAAAWNEGAPVPMSVNASVAQLLCGTFVEDVAAALDRSGLGGERLHVEVTETLFAGDRARVAAVLSGLRALGVRITIDDFGTGFSSLSYLSTLPVDIIKIDRAFVCDIERSARSIVEAIVSMARSLHFEIIAEGVETTVQRNILESLGVRRHQGFLFARPMNFAEATRWLADHRPVPGGVGAGLDWAPLH
jgi:diguanylate cyclase (GGDEF)-like protein